MTKILMLILMLFALFVQEAKAQTPGQGFTTGYDTGVVDIRKYTNLAAAVTQIGSASTTLFITTPEYVTTNVTVPSTMTLMFTTSGQLNVTSPYTVTINGAIQAGNYKIFTGTGTVIFSNTKQTNTPAAWGTYTVSTANYPWSILNFGTTSLVAGSKVITFDTSSTFTSSISYFGFVTTKGSGGTGSVTQTSGSSMTIKGSGTDEVNWWAIGN